MILKDELATNESKIKECQSRLQQYQRDTQTLIQELLRLDGEQRLLLKLIKEQEATDGQNKN